MNIFFAVNNAYAEQLCVTMVSVLENNPSIPINFYVLTTDLSETSRRMVEKLKISYRNFAVHYPEINARLFEDLPITIEYISKETYFRYLIAELVPGLDKALYLDADLVVNGDLTALWSTDLSGHYIAGVNDRFIAKVNHKPEIGLEPEELYVNAGVLLFNLAEIRRDKMVAKLFDNSQKFAKVIRYQDQDVINITFRGKIKEIDSIYNFCGDNLADEPQKTRHAVVVHYNGGSKPWQWNCRYKLRKLWIKYAKANDLIQKKKIKVGLIVDEYFGAAGTAYGGYGFLARYYIGKYIPDQDIQIDVLLGRSRTNRLVREKYKVNDVNLYYLPRRRFMAKQWLKRRNYDVYLSIEMTNLFVPWCVPAHQKNLILWIQDPRPRYEWDEIHTVKLFPESCYYDQRIYDLVHDWATSNSVRFISQAHCLNQKAIDLYRLPADTPIQYLPNPVEIDKTFDVASYPKKNHIVFLGRIASVKRTWLFFEIARQMPQYEFFVLGKVLLEAERNNEIMADYLNIPNLHFVGHVEGREKEQYLKDAKILVNTSIHEALPVSFLEALSYGLLLVSNCDPDELTAKFGKWVGNVPGDGFDKVDLFVDAIEELMSDEAKRCELALAGRKYVEEIHNVPRFVHDLRRIIIEQAGWTK